MDMELIDFVVGREGFEPSTIGLKAAALLVMFVLSASQEKRAAESLHPIYCAYCELIQNRT